MSSVSTTETLISMKGNGSAPVTAVGPGRNLQVVHCRRKLRLQVEERHIVAIAQTERAVGYAAPM